MHDRTGWVRGSDGPHTIRHKTYKHLTQFTRACATCGKPFSIFVTRRVADGHADSNSFGLKNCEQHRRGVSAADTFELDMLRSKDRTMSEELAGLYQRNTELAAEVLELRARLARYEVPAAVATQKQKMPWEA